MSSNAGTVLLDSGDPDEVEPFSPSAVRGCLFSLGLALALLIPLALFLGYQLGAAAAYRRIGLEKESRIRSILEENPDLHANIRVERASGGRVYLKGSIRAQRDLVQLEKALQDQFGVEVARDMIRLLSLEMIYLD